MPKIKILNTLLYALIAILLAAPKVASASVLAIQSLPTFINTNNFKLSCTSNGGAVQFEVSKHGGTFTAFGPSINTDSNACIVQVDSFVVNDQTDYVFRAQGFTTSTTYDVSGPSPVTGYSKERVSDGEYKLRYHTPSDTDFTQVVIYRGDTVDFSADASHEIARVAASPNVDLTYSDHFAPDSSKTYFYAIRALDHAGNSSSLTGDGSTTKTVLGASTSPAGTGNTVIVLPKSGTQGSVLGSDTGAMASPSGDSTPISEAIINTNPGVLKWILTHKKVSLGIALVLLVLGYSILKEKK